MGDDSNSKGVVGGEVQPGQVWEDCDPRSEGRAVRVERLFRREGQKYACTEPYALCTVIADRKGARRSSVGRKVQIALRRLRPGSTGYRLVTPTTNEVSSDG